MVSLSRKVYGHLNSIFFLTMFFDNSMLSLFALTDKNKQIMIFSKETWDVAG
jgi:hypothetical protein